MSSLTETMSSAQAATWKAPRGKGLDERSSKQTLETLEEPIQRVAYRIGREMNLTNGNPSPIELILLQMATSDRAGEFVAVIEKLDPTVALDLQTLRGVGELRLQEIHGNQKLIETIKQMELETLRKCAQALIDGKVPQIDEKDIELAYEYYGLRVSEEIQDEVFNNRSRGYTMETRYESEGALEKRVGMYAKIRSNLGANKQELIERAINKHIFHEEE